MSNDPVFVSTKGGETQAPIRTVPQERGEHGVYTVPVHESVLGRKVGDAGKPPNDEEGVR